MARAESALAAPASGFGNVEFFPDVIDKAAVLCSRIVRNHPLPDGNKRVAFLSLLRFLQLNDLTWQPSGGDPDESVSIIEGAAAGEVDEVQLAAWIRRRTTEQR